MHTWKFLLLVIVCVYADVVTFEVPFEEYQVGEAKFRIVSESALVWCRFKSEVETINLSIG